MSFGLPPVPLHLCSPADTVPPRGGPVLMDCDSCLSQLVIYLNWVLTGRGGCNPLLSVVTTFGLIPGASHFSQNLCSLAPTGGAIATAGTFLTRLLSSSDLHRKHLSHILFLCNSDNKRELRLSFAATR